MKITQQDRDLFSRLWFPFLRFLNLRARAAEGLDRPDAVPDGAQTRRLVKYLQNHPEAAEDWAEASPWMTRGQRETVLGWTRCRQGQFFVVRFLSGGAVLLTENEEFYQAVSPSGDWRRTLSGLALPVLVRGVLVPFRGQIMAEGISVVEECAVDPAVLREMEELYTRAKKRGEVYTAL